VNKTETERDTREKRYIPTPTYKLLKGIKYKRIDDLYCILHLIYSKQNRFKSKLEKQYGWVPITRKVLRELIGRNENVSLALNFLYENEIIDINNFYNPDYGISIHYKIKSDLLGDYTEVRITDKKINARLKKVKKAAKEVFVKNQKFQQSEYFDKFSLDSDGATKAAKERCIGELRGVCDGINYNLTDSQLMDIIECTGNYVEYRGNIKVYTDSEEITHIIHRYMVHQMRINSICNGFLFFKRNDTNGRLDSNLTTLPSYLRKFIISDDRLYNVDIKNSQPYFLYTKLVNEPSIDKKDLEKFGRWVTSGVLYEELILEWYKYKGKEKDRKEIKSMMMMILFSKIKSYNGDRLPYKPFFRTVFPSIMDYIDDVNSEKNNTLAIMLQERESTVVLDIVVPKLNAVKINTFTIHDSYICTEDELETVVETITNTCMEMYGIAPNLHQEPLWDVEDREVEIDVEVDDSIDFLNYKNKMV